MHNILCSHFSREMTILSDGTVTTCCVDNEGTNRFASIYENDFNEVVNRHLITKKKYIENLHELPACVTCMSNWRERPYMHKSTDDMDVFLSEPFIPTQFVIEVTSKCNIQCKACIHNYMQNNLSSVRSNGDGFLDLEQVVEWLRPRWGKIDALRMYNYGEPFLHKGLEGFCKTMKEKSPGVFISISSNGTSFGSERRMHSIVDGTIDHIIVSIHGGTAETAQKYMGKDFRFDLAVKNISQLMKIREHKSSVAPVVDLKCVLFEWNESDEAISAFEKLAEELDVDRYHFVPTGGAIGAKRLAPQSEAWDAFKATGRSMVNRRVANA